MADVIAQLREAWEAANTDSYFFDDFLESGCACGDCQNQRQWVTLAHNKMPEILEVLDAIESVLDDNTSVTWGRFLAALSALKGGT